jgi:mannose-6-phosphate isomerase-like protein (cupin superfamily)
MPSYTQKNLKDLDSSSAAGSSLEMRFGRSHLDSDHLGVSYVRYSPGHRPGFGHHHREQEEVYVVVGGSGRMRLDDEIIDLAQWDAVRVSPEVVRGLEAGPDGLEIIAVGSDRPEGGDGVLVKDWWTD